MEAVRTKPILYDTKLKEFRNKTMKENAWQKISQEMSTTGAILCIFCFDVTVCHLIGVLMFQCLQNESVIVLAIDCSGRMYQALDKSPGLC